MGFDNAPSFKPVMVKYKIQGGAHRDASGATVRETGLTTLNLNATESLDKLAHAAGLDADSYVVTLSVDDRHGLVAVSPAAIAENAMPVRRNQNKTVTIHLGGVFDQYPHLRVAGTQTCMAKLWPDGENPQALILSLQATLTKRRTAQTNRSAEKPI